MSFVEVVFNLPVNHPFTYKLSPAQENAVPGMRALVPFGKRVITGIIVRKMDKSNFSSIRNVLDVLDAQPLISDMMMELTAWIADYYASSWGQALQLALPRGLDEAENEHLFLVEEKPDVEINDRARELYFLIGESPGKSKSYYRKKTGSASFYSVLNILIREGLVYIERKHQKARVKTLLKKYVDIPLDYRNRRDSHADFLKYTRRRPEVDGFLSEKAGESIAFSEFLKKTSMAHATIQKMAAKGIVVLSEKVVERRPDIGYSEHEQEFQLTPEQQNALTILCEKVESAVFASILLHGITGSGKTLVYIETLKKVIQRGKNAIILIPEISLTPQTVSRFRVVFGDAIAVFHSKMSPGERLDAWMACYKGKIKIAIGPRSALFAPLQNIGLIVVDEEHEQSYKQTSASPGYNARDVALYLGRMHNALVILGSATPSFETYNNVSLNKHLLIEMMTRVNHRPLPNVLLVDMRKEKAQPVFSTLLLEKMRERIALGQQTILLQNRRGYAAFEQCGSCGYISKCPECEVSLTYHSFDEKMRCHYCGFSIPAANHCPNCGSKDLIRRGVGTQRIVEELGNHFKDISFLRMDQDTTRGKNAHDKILSEFREGKVPVLLGTQMISKGLDFPNVTLVGVISADVGLNVPDFRSSERVFQLLAQVAGRSGRGTLEGEVVIQSYHVEHYAIQYAKKHDFKGFYTEEIKHRQNYNYAPFIRIIQLTVSAEKVSEAINLSRQMAIPLRRMLKGYAEIIGPAPAALSKLKNLYRWQIMIKVDPLRDHAGKRTKQVLRDLLAPYLNKRKSGLYIHVDVDPSFAG